MSPTKSKRGKPIAKPSDRKPSDGKPSDRELVDRSIEGDLSTFEELIGRYQQAVFNIAYYKSRNCFDAEDLSQEIFLAAFRALSTLKDRDNFASWLFGIAYNRCHKWYHRERNKIIKIQEVRRRVEQEVRLARRSQGPLGSPEEKPPLAEFMKKLPEDVRKVLTLKYLEGMSYQEIEERMGIKPHRIDYLIRKGKRSIREQWEAVSNG